MSNLYFDVNLFLQESKNTLLNPNKYFSSMKISGGYSEPLIKTIAYGTLTGLVYLVCWLFRIKSFGAGYTGDVVGLLAFIKIIVVTIIGSFIGALLLVIISTFCRGNSDFERSFRVTSSLMAILPVYSVLSISWVINIYFGVTISLIMSLYFLWLLYFGLTAALRGRQKSVQIVLYIIMVIVVFFLVLNVRSVRRQDKAKTETEKPHKEQKKNVIK
jgi:hypothetical protein